MKCSDRTLNPLGYSYLLHDSGGGWPSRPLPSDMFVVFSTVNMNKIFLFLNTPPFNPCQGVLSWEPSPGLGASTHQLLSPHCYRYWFSLQPRGLHAQDASKAAPPQLPNMSHITTRYTSFLFKSLSKMFSGGHSQEHADFSSNFLNKCYNKAGYWRYYISADLSSLLFVKYQL